MLIRTIASSLAAWAAAASRKPLLLKGARQVGKSFSVRELGKTFPSFVEVNFERTPELRAAFEGDLSPKAVLQKLQILAKQRIVSGSTLLFLDEVQDCPAAITALRYFYEELPGLHVVAAGSLLEFELQKQGVPVGRFDYLHLFPLSFFEFLEARGQELLRSAIQQQPLDCEFEPALHQKALEEFKIFSLIGGLPEVVRTYLDTGDLLAAQEIQSQIINTYRDDFRKYVKTKRILYAEDIFNAAPRLLGSKFIASKVRSDLRAGVIFDTLQALDWAGVLHKVYHSSANGVPLGAEIKRDHFKVCFLDIGLMQRMLGLDLRAWVTSPALTAINQGAVAEQIVAQELLSYRSAHDADPLFYWHREARSSNAEVDYVVPLGSTVLPIEVKAGGTGHIKSLHQFLIDKPQHKLAVKISTNNFSRCENVFSIPCYAVARVLEVGK